MNINKKVLIFINGKSGSGKTTLAEHLAKELGEADTLIVENSHKVKEIATEFYFWDKVKDEQGRQLLIDITNAGYKYDPFLWEKFTAKKIINTGCKYIIIPDWRYESTYEYLVEFLPNMTGLIEDGGYKVLSATRVGLESDVYTSYSDAVTSDISEQGLTTTLTIKRRDTYSGDFFKQIKNLATVVKKSTKEEIPVVRNSF